MKTIAFYLPQFHTIPENDKWWGEGFTEWVNVKASKPQFRGHIQPEIPYDNNYYCLLDSEVQEKQAEMAKKYGVYGFCYYHYWFEGKLLLEKPMEKMLHNKNVDIPFCICWANETWSRTWNGKESEILIKQNYNETEEEWERHFNYLLPFFKDARYITEQNKPMVIIYKPHLIEHCDEMLKFWREKAKDAGFDGLYIGYQHPTAFDSDLDSCEFDFAIEFEPLYTAHELRKGKRKKSACQKLKYSISHLRWEIYKVKHKLKLGPNIISYDEIWKRIVTREPSDAKNMPGAFTAWDNTPRRKKEATVFYKASPEKFEKYFKEQVQRTEMVYHSDYLFINAWNEWAEGAHLEPDTDNKFGYLEAVNHVLDGKRISNKRRADVGDMN